VGRPSNTAERRSDIVRGMRRVVARAGYAGATVPDIARAARLAPGLVHYHFADKRAVLVALVEDLEHTFLQRVATRESGARSAAARLHAFLDAAVALGPDADEDAVACWVAVSAEAVRDRVVREAVARSSARLVDALRARVREALREAGASPQAARAHAAPHAAALWSAIQGSFALATTAPHLIPRGTMAPALHTLADALLTRTRKEDA
jgi:TetR/AcrR family transcriptional repressor of bet genes